MHTESSSQLLPAPGTGPRPTVWQRVLLSTLLALALTAGVVIAATPDPDWDGSPPVNMSSHPQTDRIRPSMSVSNSGRILIAWSYRPPGTDTIANLYTALFNQYTELWGPAQVLTTTPRNSLTPDTVLVGDRAFVIWKESIESGSAGVTVTIQEAEVGAGAIRRVPLPFADHYLSYHDAQPRASAHGGRLHLVFAAVESAEPSALYYSTRALNEPTWATATKIADPTLWGIWHPMIAHTPDGMMHIVWEDQLIGGDSSINYMTATFSGGTINTGSPMVLSTGVDKAVWPAIATDSWGKVHIAWGEVVEGPGNDANYVDYVQYNSTTHSWVVSPYIRIDSVPVYVNAMSPSDAAPAVGVIDSSAPEVCIAWHGYRDTEPLDPREDILIKCSGDGQNWNGTANMSRVPGGMTPGDPADIGVWPDVDGDATGMHGVWTQGVGGDPADTFEVYYSNDIKFEAFLPLVFKNG